MPSRSGKFAQSIISRRKRHAREVDKAQAAENSSSTALLIFESLEPRLLLAADPLGISAGYALNDASSMPTADAPGHGVIDTLVHGAGHLDNGPPLGSINSSQQNAATPQTNQSKVSVTYANAQVAGDINILTISWDNTTSNITSVTDSAGNRYRLAVPAGNGVNQAIYYATNIKEATAGTNTVTVTFSESTPSADIRALEFDGLQLVQQNSTANADGAGQHDKSAPWGSITGSQRNSTANADGAGQHDKSAPWGSITGSQRNSTANVPIDPIQTEMVTPAAAAAAPAAAAAAFATPTFVQVNSATPQTNQSTVAVTFTNAQVAGDTNILAIGWNNTTSNITSVTDSAGNVYQLAVPTARGAGISQAIYYAKNIKAAAAGTNTVTVAFSASTPFVDIRALEYSGLDPVNPFDVGTSASGSGTSANSGTVTTTSAGALIFGAGITTGGFSAAGANFVNRIITTPDLDIAEDRFVTTTGSYGATASLGGSAAWVMQVATFRAAVAGGGDTIAPTVQSINRVGTTPTNAASLSWTVLFSESVTAVDAGDFTLVTTGTVAGATITTVSGSGNQYTVTANTGTGNGTLGLNLVDNDTILDTSANPLGGPGVNGNFTGQSYTIDKTQPTVTITQAAGQADPTNTSPINFTVTFSETVTGFASNDISFAGSTVGGTLTAVVTGTGPTYNVAVSGMTTAGNVVASVPAGAATDAAGNLSLGSTSTDNTVAYTAGADTIAPTATITAPTGAAPVSGTVTVTANATDNVGVAGVQFLLDNNALGAEDTTSPYSVSWNTTTAANGTHTLTARARDVNGNTALSAPVTVNVANAIPATPAFVQVNAATPQTNQSTVAVTYTNAQVVGDTNILAIGWNNTTSNVTSVTDSAGNVYQLAVPTARGAGISQAIYYAKNIKAAAAGTNTVTVAFSASTPFVDIRALEYSGLDPVNPFDVGTSASGSGTSANSGTVTTTSAGALIFGAGITTGGFSAAGANFVNRIITTPDLDIAEDRFVTTTGSYGATASLGGSAAWVMQVATFRAAVAGGGDTIAPTATITAPTGAAPVSGIVTVTANATDNVGVAGVQFLLDNNALGAEDTTSPYSVSWDTTTAANGTHTLVARARDVNGNTALSAPVSVNVANTGFFQNDILATGFDLPTAIKFLPDGRMLVVELAGTIKVLPPPYTQADPTPFLTLTNVGSNNDGTVQQQGIYDIALDPNFATNHFYYIFYTAATPNRDRLSRFTANSTLTGTVPGSELILYQDTQNANTEHHGGAINFGNDGKIYFTTGDYFLGTPSQDLTSPGGKILRINPDGTVPTDNPFYDGSGPNYDAIWALGLRNPYRAYYDVPTGRLLIGDVGGNNASTAIEELNVGVRGANYGWPNVEGTSSNPAYTNPIYSYPHNGRDAAITGGFVYHGTQFPSSYQGSYFFADYAQNWIKRLTFDASGNVSGVFNFEPANGAADGPTGDIVYLTEGPEGALYYVDLGVSDTTGTVGVSKIRRISFVGSSDLPPVVSASANPTQGPTPLVVNFSSAGSSDPEGKPLTYSWNFGDNTTSTAANPTHTYNIAGPYQVRLTVSDGVNSTLSTPISISAGTRPTATILSPTDGVLFKAGDVISFSGSATDVEDGTLPASAYTWNIDFLHEGHVHPGTPITGVTSGTFTIPTSGHDFSGFTRYRISLTVTDSSGLQSTSSVTIFPQKVNLTFDAVPAGATLFLDGIAHTAPFVYDTLIGFNHTIEARNQTIGSNTYTFASWSDGGAQTHTIVVPGAAQTYTANFNVTPAAPAIVQVNAATPQTNQSAVSVTFTNAQVAGDTNILAIGWNNTTSNITSVTDSAGNVYQLAVPTARGAGISQAIYYAKNIKAAAAGTNTVTVAFSASTPFVDIRALEYSGLDPVNPFDVGTSASGSGTSANSGTVTTTSAGALIFGAGITTGGFSAAGANFVNRIITTPDLDIAEDRFVTTTGSYGATASLGGSAAWVMQVATFRAASGSIV